MSEKILDYPYPYCVVMELVGTHKSVVNISLHKKSEAAIKRSKKYKGESFIYVACYVVPVQDGHFENYELHSLEDERLYYSNKRLGRHVNIERVK